MFRGRCATYRPGTGTGLGHISVPALCYAASNAPRPSVSVLSGRTMWKGKRLQIFFCPLPPACSLLAGLHEQGMHQQFQQYQRCDALSHQSSTRPLAKLNQAKFPNASKTLNCGSAGVSVCLNSAPPQRAAWQACSAGTARLPRALVLRRPPPVA